MGIDLFEVIAELAGLDLDSEPDADEATRLACEARQRLSSPSVEGRRWR
jgi:streptomycin 6-kinase